MTKKEAINRIKSIRKKISEPTETQLGWLETWINTKDIEALDIAIEALEKEPKLKWIPASTPPKQDGKYLVSTHYFDCDKMEILGYANNLYEVDNYDFWDAEERAGWYEYDAEYGYCECNGVVKWCELPQLDEKE